MVKSADYSADRVKVEAGRIRLPGRFAQRLKWVQGGEPIEAWLLMIRPGRYRLLSREQVDSSVRLKALAEQIYNPPEPDPETEPFEAESSASAALSARLLPARLSPRGPGWRLTIPKNALGLVRYETVDIDNTLFLLFSDGYLEVWSPEAVADAAAAPPDRVIS
jgi:hypothetical protein